MNWDRNTRVADYDALFIGAGHNALVCAAYLARAGYRVCLLERRPVVGGAVVTEEIIPGYRFDLGGSAHILIHHTPIVADLGLAQYGLEYIDLDPLFFAPFPDGSRIFMWKDIERTCQSIATVSPADATAYWQFIKTWRPLAEGMVEAFIHTPSLLNLGRYLAWAPGCASGGIERLADMLQGYGQMLRQTFSSPQVQAMIGWMAAQSGPPPGEPFSAPFALWHPMYHVSGVKRPRGGSGMLTQALARMIEANGGTIRTSTPVQRILVEKGKAAGAQTTAGDRITARVVVSGAHIHTTLQLLGDGIFPGRAQRLLQRARPGNGFG
ncbi:MAG: NAD(P)/FAD-dependent oxidoreductase, partial [Chloroflexi bacterium]|nr:NAD(P)/FAD-dependent oxidoreductase [Chloroflexota bacterium]